MSKEIPRRDERRSAGVGVCQAARHGCILGFGLAPCQRGLANIWAEVACADSCFLPEHLSLSLESLPLDPELCRCEHYFVDKDILKLLPPDSGWCLGMH